MADQMTPAEMRAEAVRHYHCLSSERDVDVLIDAARRLADVIEWAASVSQEEEYPTFDAGWEEAALHVLDIARGETNEREKP